MKTPSRRDCMAWALAAAGSLSTGEAFAATRRSHPRKHRHRHWPAAGTDPDSLNAIAMSKGLRFGSSIGTGPSGAPGSMIREASKRSGSYKDPMVRALMVAQCGLLVPENELKWYALRPKPDVFDFRRADILMDFATQHAMGVRGHTLLWNRNRWMPSWVVNYDFGPTPATEAERILREHIAKVCSRYGDRIFSYDVINETIAPDTGELEDSVFSKVLGPDVVDICFHAAREASPNAQLVYNDYMGWNADGETHRAGVLKLLERMKANNVPIDALGVQSHIGSSKQPVDASGFGAVDEAAWRKFLDEVTAMGLDLVITEFDVNDRYLPADIAQRDQAVADFGKRYLDLMLGYPQLRYVMAWGLVDKYSWLEGNTPRPDGLAKRPNPYDDHDRPKPLREAMAQAFAAAPERPAMTIKPA